MKTIIVIFLLILFFAPITSGLLAGVVILVGRILSYGFIIIFPILAIFFLYKIIKSIKEDKNNE